LTSEQVDTAIATAHRRGVPVAIHAHFSEASIVVAIRAGCDTLEHGYVLSDLSVGVMRAKGIALCPTLSAIRAILDHQADYRTWRGREVVEAAEENWESAQRSVRLAHENGVSIIAGTDAGLPLVGFGSLASELECLVELGLSCREALNAGTAGAAVALGRADIGRMVENCRADLVVLAANPLENIAALREVRMVIQGGRVVVDRPAVGKTNWTTTTP
jgi:imidazolonepropionase-like amidohydrolase